MKNVNDAKLEEFMNRACSEGTYDKDELVDILIHLQRSATEEGHAVAIRGTYRRYCSMTAAEFGKWLEDEYKNTD